MKQTAYKPRVKMYTYENIIKSTMYYMNGGVNPEGGVNYP